MSYRRYIGLLLTLASLIMWIIEASNLHLSRLITHRFPHLFHVEKSYISPIDGISTGSSGNISADIYLHSALLIILFLGLVLLFKPAGSLFKTIEMEQRDKTEKEFASP